MTDLRCHFDANGWLQGPIRITHVLSPNHGTGFGTGRGIVMHTEAGFEAGTVATFTDGSKKVSAFFSVARDGSGHQYVPVGKGLVAWSQMAGNEAWRGIEDEDLTHPSIPLTGPQVTFFAQVTEACSEFDGFPLQVTDDVNGHGLICHSDGGVAWGNHPDCPGNVRRAQRPHIIALAMSIRQEATMTAQPRPWTTAGMSSLATLAKEQKTTPAAILQVTAQHGALPAAVASYLDGVFGGTVSVSQPMPKGLALYLPAAS